MPYSFMWYTFFGSLFLMIISCRIQPVYVVDVASAIITALKDDGTSMGKVYELGGPDIFTVHELVNLSLIPANHDILIVFL